MPDQTETWDFTLYPKSSLGIVSKKYSHVNIISETCTKEVIALEDILAINEAGRHNKRYWYNGNKNGRNRMFLIL